MCRCVSLYIWFIVKPGMCQPVGSVCLVFRVALFICLFVCVSTPRLLITSGMMRCNIHPYHWFNKLYGFYTAAVVGIISGHSLNIHTCHEN